LRLSLTRTVGFRATHHYARPEWSAADNRARFGAATEPHPHDYRCGVTVSGPADPATGMIADLGALDQLLARVVVDPFDGKDINRDVAGFGGAGRLPTCEALAAYFFDRIGAGLPAGLTLERVRVAEDETLAAECARQER
jgi:6-pyruvoyltetrahydropterin/6-carboxytetrahydropterin synthase